MKENVKLLIAIAHIQAAKDCLNELKTSSLMTREMKVTTNNFNKAYKRSFEKVISTQLGKKYVKFKIRIHQNHQTLLRGQLSKGHPVCFVVKVHHHCCSLYFPLIC